MAAAEAGVRRDEAFASGNSHFHKPSYQILSNESGYGSGSTNDHTRSSSHSHLKGCSSSANEDGSKQLLQGAKSPDLSILPEKTESDCSMTSNDATAPLLSNVPPSTYRYQPEDYETEKQRTLTYINYKGQIPVTVCVAAGFVHVKDAEVICPWCKIHLDLQSSSETIKSIDFTSIISLDMIAFHETQSRSCEFLKKLYSQTGDTTPNRLQELNSDGSLQVNQTASGPSVVTYQTDAIAASASAASDSTQTDLYRTLKQKRLKSLTHAAHIQGDSLLDQSSNQMYYQKNRTRSFQRLIAKSKSCLWKTFASDGFYLQYDQGQELGMTCIFCKISFKFNLDEASDPEFKTKVRKNHENRPCRFILGDKSLPHKNIPDLFEDVTWNEESDSNSQTATSEGGEMSLGIDFNQAAHPEMAVPDRRKATFLTFPYGSVKHSDELCETGCFYSGGEYVTCFSCDTKFFKFDHGENVWTRHARSAPSCTFVRYHKGQDFINRALDQHGPYVAPPKEPKITNMTMRMLRPRIDSPAVTKALDMGLDREEVKTAIGNRLKSGELDFRWVADIFREVKVAKVPNQVLTEASIELPTVISGPREAQATQEVEEAEVVVDNEEMEIAETEKKEEEVDGEVKLEDKHMEESTTMTEDPTTLAPKIKAQLVCKICLSDIVGIIFIPCGHLVCCTMCSAAMNVCPICRHSINGTIKANFN